MARAQLGHSAGEEAGGGRLERADAQGGPCLAGGGADVGLEAAELLEHAVGAAQQRLARERRAHGARVALEQARVERLLEARDVLGDGGLREAERFGGGGEGSANGDFAEGGEEPGVEHKVTLSQRAGKIICHYRLAGRTMYP